MAFDYNDTWEDHTIMTWDYEGVDVIYLLGEEKEKYHVDIAWLSKDLLYKDIPMTYVNSESDVNRE
jgi:hypothetical protein